MLNLHNEMQKIVSISKCTKYSKIFANPFVYLYLMKFLNPLCTHGFFILFDTINLGSRHIYPSLVLVQPRKTPPCLAERLLMGRKESNQTNKQTNKQTINLGWSIVYIKGAQVIISK